MPEITLRRLKDTLVSSNLPNLDYKSARDLDFQSDELTENSPLRAAFLRIFTGRNYLQLGHTEDALFSFDRASRHLQKIADIAGSKESIPYLELAIECRKQSKKISKSLIDVGNSSRNPGLIKFGEDNLNWANGYIQKLNKNIKVLKSEKRMNKLQVIDFLESKLRSNNPSERLACLQDLLDREVPEVSSYDAKGLDKLSEKCWTQSFKSYVAYRLTTAVNYELQEQETNLDEEKIVFKKAAMFSYDKATKGLNVLAQRADNRGDENLASDYSEMAVRCSVRSCLILDYLIKDTSDLIVKEKYLKSLEFSQKRIKDSTKFL